MNRPFLTLPLLRKRDLVVARQRARQLARALGFAPCEEAGVAATVFEIARAAFRHPGHCALHFTLEGGLLRVHADGAPLRLERALPDHAPAVALKDLTWIARELTRLTPPNLFAEFCQQNQELLRLLEDVRALREERRGAERPSAA